jgi:hypothetical protein
MNIFINWLDPHVGLLAYEMRVIVGRKAKWKALEFPLGTKILNQKPYYIPRGNIENSHINKYLKDTGMVNPSHCYSKTFLLRA